MPTKNTPRTAIEEVAYVAPESSDTFPNLNTLPASEIDTHMAGLVSWLEERGAEVSGPKTTCLPVKNVTTADGAGDTASESEESEVVCESKMSWSYKGSDPITIAHVSGDELDAYRKMAFEAHVRRYEV
jgi:hypothetical protein